MIYEVIWKARKYNEKNQNFPYPNIQRQQLLFFKKKSGILLYILFAPDSLIHKTDYPYHF